MTYVGVQITYQRALSHAQAAGEHQERQKWIQAENSADEIVRTEGEKKNRRKTQGKKKVKNRMHVKLVAFLAGDLGVLTVSVPFFSLCQQDRNLLRGRPGR